MSTKYCGMCDAWLTTTKKECPTCGFDLQKAAK